MNQGHKIKLVFAGLAAFVVLIVIWQSLVVVPAGHVGVVTTFGRVEPEALPEGMHFVAFWRSVHDMSTRTQERKEIADVPTLEGLTVQLDVSMLFSLEREKASEVYQKVGPDYAEIVVVPQLRSALRGITVNFKSEALYTANRGEVESRLESTLKGMLHERGINCEKVMFRSVKLPDQVRDAIDRKVAFEQKKQQSEIEVQTAEIEARKKLVEAEATRDAQKLIQETLSENYVRYLWVKALETAANNRATVIYVPTGNDGLPVIAPARGSPAVGNKAGD
jgi:regulator of protease activity HflC (stomatin/prohibitin superfamily)